MIPWILLTATSVSHQIHAQVKGVSVVDIYLSYGREEVTRKWGKKDELHMNLYPSGLKF
jgi:hypothetical protein